MVVDVVVVVAICVAALIIMLAICVVAATHTEGWCVSLPTSRVMNSLFSPFFLLITSVDSNRYIFIYIYILMCIYTVLVYPDIRWMVDDERMYRYFNKHKLRCGSPQFFLVFRVDTVLSTQHGKKNKMAYGVVPTCMSHVLGHNQSLFTMSVLFVPNIFRIYLNQHTWK